ncbi:SDR family NAD(P)-dependent oxidoreductase [Paenibacillus elgii]
MSEQQNENRNGLEVAVIGLSCRFPGASNWVEFWENLKNGKDSISSFSDEQLERSGIEKELRNDPAYVKAKGILGDAEWFDPSFFGYTPTEAALMDPQIRIFHECAWHALEDAGYDPKAYARPIGLYAGSSNHLDWQARTLVSELEIDDFSKSLLSDKDLLAQLIAYKLHLTGPAFTVQAACATSLVAVHLACQALIGGECDMALAGGASITVPEQQGYLYHEHMHESPDGRSRAFDASAQGTVFSNGAGVVVLKMLEDALADGDHIYGVIKGSAINNDGSRKTGFTAPSPQGQAEAIRGALRAADVAPETITYIEAHGTATPIGDPIEIEALKAAFHSSQKGFCKIGSVKSNFGHLDAAAGIAGLIKTLLALKHRLIPPTLHFTVPNPRIDFQNSPFEVSARLEPWKRDLTPLRAGVSSFGIGGTNAHIILEEAPESAEEPQQTGEGASNRQLIVLSARTESSLQRMSERLAEHLSEYPGTDLAAASFTLQTGRRGHEYRRFVIGSSAAEAAEALKSAAQPRLHVARGDAPPVIFLFSGIGEQWSPIHSGDELYRAEERFRKRMDECFGILRRLYGRDLKPLLYPASRDRQPDDLSVYAEPLQCSIAYSFGALLMDWGIRPQSMAGDWMGEAVCACLSGELPLEEAFQRIQAGGGMHSGAPEERQTGSAAHGRKFRIPFIPIGDIGQTAAALLQSQALFIELGSAESGSCAVRLQECAHAEKAEAVILLPERDKEGRLPYSIDYVLSILGECWVRGKEPKWDRLHESKRPSRLPLPGYVFDRKLYTIEEDPYASLPHSIFQKTVRKNPNVSQWFYAPAWESSFLPPREEQGIQGGVWLLFTDQTGIGRDVADRLRLAGHEVAMVEQGREFRRSESGSYQIDPQEHGHYVSLLQSVLTGEKKLSRAVHFWSVSEPQPFVPDKETVRQAQDVGFYSLIHLANALRSHILSGEIAIDVVANQTMSVTQNEALRPEKATILGPCRVIPQEYPNIACRYIDIELPEGGWRTSQTAMRLIHELTSESSDPVVAYRGDVRWVQTFKPFLLGPPKRERLPLKEGGVYLITGGLGRVGYALADYLAKSWKAKLVLTGSSSLPEKDQWAAWLEHHSEQEATSRKIRKLQELERSGGAVWACRADAADVGQMRTAIRETESRFGRLDGVVHAAGSRDDTLDLLENHDPRASEKQFVPKIYGTMVLAELLKDKTLDFCLLTSSISSVLGGLAHTPYAAANIFMDVFVQAIRSERAVPWISVNWDSWGIFEEEQETAVGTEVVQLAMTPEEGIQAFERALYLREIGQVVVSTSDMQARIDRWIKRESLRDDDPEATRASSRSFLEQQDGEAVPETREQIEDALIRIWRQVLGMSNISREDNFFELGGDSLKAVTILSMTYKKLNLKIPLVEFFQAASIRNLSEFVTVPQEVAGERIEPAAKQDSYPLSSAQRRLFALEQVRETGTSYNIPYAFVMEGAVDPARIAQAFRALVARHESLRTYFEYRDGGPVQVILETLDLEIHTLEWDEPQIEPLIRRFVYPFDIGTAPLLRVVMAKLAPDKYLLIIDMHHLITDGTSIGLMTKEFLQLYQGVALPALNIQYKDYAVWQNKRQHSEKMLKQRAYWLGKFAGELPVLKLPTDNDRSTAQSFEGSSLHFTIDAATTERLRALAMEEDVSLYMLMFGVYQVFLHKISGQEDIVVGSVATGRSHVEMESMLGVFINTLALRTFPERGKSFAQYLKEVKTCVLEAFDHQDYQFDQLVEEVGAKLDSNRNPLFDTMFEWQNVYSEQLDIEDMHITPVPFEHQISQFDLVFIGWEAPEELVFEAVYRTGLFHEASIRKFIAFFQEIAGQIAENRHLTLQEIEISHNLVTAQASKEKIEFDF